MQSTATDKQRTDKQPLGHPSPPDTRFYRFCQGEKGGVRENGSIAGDQMDSCPRMCEQSERTLALKEISSFHKSFPALPVSHRSLLTPDSPRIVFELHVVTVAALPLRLGARLYRFGRMSIPQ